MSNDLPWERREAETSPAFEAFREYLNQGGARSTEKVARQLSKSKTIVTRWSSEHGWVERARAYDSYVTTTEVDGYAEQLSSVRNRHLAIAAKLMAHLDSRLDTFIAMGQDPTVRWTQALAAGSKIDQAAVEMREQDNSKGVLEQIMEKLQKLGGE